MSIGPILSLQNRSIGLGIGSSIERIIGTKLSGPSGIEAIIEYSGLYLNDRSWIDTYVVETIDGIDDADIRDVREEFPGDHGELLGASFYGGRTIVLSGYIETKTIWKMRDMIQAMRFAFADITQEKPLIFHHYDPEYTLQVNCKKSQKLMIQDQQTTLNETKRTFSITLRASNPRFLSRDEIYSSIDFSTSTYDDIAFSAVNNGNFVAQPQFNITGPFDTLILTNEANNRSFELLTDIPSGEEWIFDTATHRVIRESDGVSKYASLTDTSEEILFESVDFQPSNNIHVEATGLTTDSLIELRYHHTYM